MQNRKWYEWLLVIVYVLMIGICVYLNLFSGQPEGVANIIVNVVMFIIVGLILLECERKCFIPVTAIEEELNRVTEKIKKDTMGAHQFLWDEYGEHRAELFQEPTLKEEYQDYLYEMNRISRSGKAYYKCDIEEYINYDLVDAKIHRNQLNQVAGAMTGLGILGTFIGLSLGLQSFSTGTTAEVMNSIAPLMDGIKVAFHTSIYGMVFSLVFNYVYKRKLNDAETAVGSFLSAYKKYVLPDTTTDGINRLMELQQQQTIATKALADTVGVQLSESLSNLLKPQFDRFDETLTHFGNVATQRQTEALGKIVTSFIAEMNKSLNNSFSQLSYTIDQTFLTQQENAKQMQEILERTGNATENLTRLDNQTSLIQESNQILLDQERQYFSDLAGYRENMNEQISLFAEQLEQQRHLLDNLRTAMTRMPQDIDETFRVIDENLVDVEEHFRGTVEQIKEVTAQVPDVITDSYARMERAMDRAASSVEELNSAIDRITQEGSESGRTAARRTRPSTTRRQ
ncbi:MAG: MotA/TolQ/ExbB proton channel family protein [Lachnospiraceae bacterium]|nr:MotA/TolQ/ExbB proton channel family protein [Lachnospiraceae bacterium]